MKLLKETNYRNSSYEFEYTLGHYSIKTPIGEIRSQSNKFPYFFLCDIMKAFNLSLSEEEALNLIPNSMKAEELCSIINDEAKEQYKYLMAIDIHSTMLLANIAPNREEAIYVTRMLINTILNIYYSNSISRAAMDKFAEDINKIKYQIKKIDMRSISNRIKLNKIKK